MEKYRDAFLRALGYQLAETHTFDELCNITRGQLQFYKDELNNEYIGELPADLTDDDVKKAWCSWVEIAFTKGAFFREELMYRQSGIVERFAGSLLDALRDKINEL